jgi:iron complex outermembrane receptor protein
LVYGVLIDRGTIPPTNDIASLFDGEILTPEKSKNYSVGAVLKFTDLHISIAVYQVELKDRITQSAVI